MLAKSTKLLLHLLLVVAVPLLEGGDRFPNILSAASGASGQVQYKGAVTSHMLVDVVCLLSVAAGKLFSFFKYGTGYFAVVAFKASRRTMLVVVRYWFPFSPSHQPLKIFRLLIDKLKL